MFQISTQRDINFGNLVVVVVVVPYIIDSFPNQLDWRRLFLLFVQSKYVINVEYIQSVSPLLYLNKKKTEKVEGKHFLTGDPDFLFFIGNPSWHGVARSLGGMLLNQPANQNPNSKS